jgi:hypothetical protein
VVPFLIVIIEYDDVDVNSCSTVPNLVWLNFHCVLYIYFHISSRFTSSYYHILPIETRTKFFKTRHDADLKFVKCRIILTECQRGWAEAGASVDGSIL